MPVGHDDHKGGTDAGASPAREMLPRWRVKLYGHTPVEVQAISEELAIAKAARALGYLMPPENTQALRLDSDAV